MGPAEHRPCGYIKAASLYPVHIYLGNTYMGLGQVEKAKALADEIRESATTSRAGGMRMAPRRGLGHALLVVADL